MNEEEIKEEIEKYRIGLKLTNQQHDDLVKIFNFQHSKLELKINKIQGILEYLQLKLLKSKNDKN